MGTHTYVQERILFSSPQDFYAIKSGSYINSQHAPESLSTL